MARLTISVSDRDHYALKLLGIRDRKRLAVVIDEAIKFYLAHRGAYALNITSSDPGQSDLNDDDD